MLFPELNNGIGQLPAQVWMLAQLFHSCSVDPDLAKNTGTNLKPGPDLLKSGIWQCPGLTHLVGGMKTSQLFPVLHNPEGQAAADTREIHPDTGISCIDIDILIFLSSHGRHCYTTLLKTMSFLPGKTGLVGHV